MKQFFVGVTLLAVSTPVGKEVLPVHVVKVEKSIKEQVAEEADSLVASTEFRALALDIAYTESHFDRLAVHTNTDGTKDWGVMQLNDRVVKGLHVTDPLNAAENIRIGVGLLAGYYHRYHGDLNRVRCAYRSGPGNCN